MKTDFDIFQETADHDCLVRILRSYRLQYTQDEFGVGLGLEDVLTPPDQSTVRLGIMEIRLLADYILGEINFSNNQTKARKK